jgi:hypothetical protein
MNKKSKLLKIWTRTTTYLTVIATLVLFTEPLSAGYVRDGNDNTNPGQPRRVVQVVLGHTNNNVDAHPDVNNLQFVQAAFTDENIVRSYMRDTLPEISGETHIQFWLSRNQGTHDLHALFGAAGAQENAYIYAINNIVHAQQIVPANITFSLHLKD